MWGGVGLLSHEYFHLFNVKRLRPVELGPFDFEKSPTTGSLSTAVSSSRLVKPSRVSVFDVCDIAVAMVRNVPSTLD